MCREITACSESTAGCEPEMSGRYASPQSIEAAGKHISDSVRPSIHRVDGIAVNESQQLATNKDLCGSSPDTDLHNDRHRDVGLSACGADHMSHIYDITIFLRR